ncbi:MAG: hypothetical protein ACYCUI_16430, partial [Vulcanimicrobiaceae bacterium]
SGPLAQGSETGYSIGVTQAYNATVNGVPTSYFVLESALPAGGYEVALDSCFDGFDVLGNTIDVRGTLSTAVVLPTDMNNVVISGNAFVGDQSAAFNGIGALYESQAIRVETTGARGSGPQYLPSGQEAPSDAPFNYNATYVSFTPLFDVVIENNTIQDPIGGIQIYTATLGIVSCGRSYAYIQMTGNT